MANLVGTMVYPDGTAFTGTLTLRLNGPAKDGSNNLVMPAYQNFAIGTTGVVDITIGDTETLTSIDSTQVFYEMILDDDDNPVKIGHLKVGTGTTYLADAWANTFDAPHSGLLCYVPLNNMVNKYPRRAGNDIGTYSSAMAYHTGKINQGIKLLGKTNNTVGDLLSFIRGTQISGENYANSNTNQGSISFWIYYMGGSEAFSTLTSIPFPKIFFTNSTSGLSVIFADGKQIDAGTVNANTWSHIVVRWDADNKIDGTNYACVSINDTHTFGITSTWAPSTPGATIELGRSAQVEGQYLRAIVDDLAIFDRVLGDGSNPTGIKDEIAEIYASGSAAEAGLAGDVALKAYFKLDGSGNLTSGTNAGLGCNFPWANTLSSNGNFEAGTNNWTSVNCLLEPVTSGTNLLYDGTSLRVNSNAGTIGKAQQEFSVGSAANYFLSVWGKNAAPAPMSFLGMDTIGSSESAWTRYEMAIQATAAITGTVLLTATSAGTGYFDNHWVGTSLLNNGGFEGAWAGGTTPDGWTRVGSCVGTQVAINTHSGAAHLRVEQGDSSGTYYQNAVTVTNNKWNMFVGYLLTGAGTCNINLSGAATSTLSGTQSTWTRKGHVFKATGATLNVRVYASSGGTANFDDMAVIQLNDIDVTATPATIGNSYDTGKWGTALGALRIDGGDTFTVPGTTTIGSNIANGTGAISLWVYPEGWHGGNLAEQRFIFDTGVGATTNRLIIYATFAAGTSLRFLIYGSNAGGGKSIDYNIGSANFGSNTWHHILASWTAAGPDSLWLNGSSVGTSSVEGTWSNLTAVGNNLYLLSNFTGAEQFDGLIDEVRIYDAIPSDANKTAIYNDGEYLGQS